MRLRGSSRKGVLSFTSFHSAVRAIAHHLYKTSPRPFDLLFERHLMPLALREGDKLLRQSGLLFFRRAVQDSVLILSPCRALPVCAGERDIVIGHSQKMTLEEEVCVLPPMTTGVCSSFLLLCGRRLQLREFKRPEVASIFSANYTPLSGIFKAYSLREDAGAKQPASRIVVYSDVRAAHARVSETASCSANAATLFVRAGNEARNEAGRNVQSVAHVRA
jgi:hypothetical protein